MEVELTNIVNIEILYLGIGKAIINNITYHSV